eukprot:CAMPEP_0184365042 /NCGR_PEP_ID=MMETSP1089-20130417/147054_1 /TAXON_ID=38269 ORGANISM="Gloeochaete wittrockiana, Strain SAG46.84" /NCGR_SAMPLE_ID=MMETSP1089 /ASSEMBLY_ACC=CAM_ASM_000445 /LENGTH=316 /DNA_ID=CAMNT_0026706129 /DNA_START=84 /DNA_END=1030 /DNA_ORIENTATION=+
MKAAFDSVASYIQRLWNPSTESSGFERLTGDVEEGPSDARQQGSVSPEERAGIFGKVAYTWLNPLMKAGFRRPLLANDLYPLRDADKAQNVAETFDRHWQVERVLPKPSFLRCMHRSFGTKFYLAGPVKALHDLFQFLSPVLLHALITFLSQKVNQPPLWQGLLIALGMFFVPTAQTLLINIYFHMVYSVGMHIRSGLVSEIYKKSLVLTSAARQDSSTGQIVTLMSSDAQRLMDLTTFMHIVWSGPFQIALAIFYLFSVLGWAAFAGLAVMVLMMPISGWMANLIAKMRKECVKATDERVKIVGEVFAGIKIVKL